MLLQFASVLSQIQIKIAVHIYTTTAFDYKGTLQQLLITKVSACGVGVSDPWSHPAPAGVAAVRELRPHALAFHAAATWLLTPGNCP